MTRRSPTVMRPRGARPASITVDSTSPSPSPSGSFVGLDVPTVDELWERVGCDRRTAGSPRVNRRSGAGPAPGARPGVELFRRTEPPGSVLRRHPPVLDLPDRWRRRCRHRVDPGYAPPSRRLRAAGFAIWPFDAPGPKTVIEIYPRLFTGPVVKRDAERRRAIDALDLDGLETRPDTLARAGGSEDAFGAALLGRRAVVEEGRAGSAMGPPATSRSVSRVGCSAPAVRSSPSSTGHPCDQRLLSRYSRRLGAAAVAARGRGEVRGSWARWHRRRVSGGPQTGAVPADRTP